MTDWLVDILVCPDCRGGLQPDDAGLVCAECERHFVIADDVPSLLPMGLEADLSSQDGDWRRWGAHLDRFITWRERRYLRRQKAAPGVECVSGADERLIEMGGLDSEDGLVLDIGCGGGSSRDGLPDAVRYVGLDPLPGGRDPRSQEMPSNMPRPAKDVTFVQGVGEALPFADATFDVVMAMGSLDHSLDADGVLAEAARVLKSGGKLCIRQGATPRANWLRKLARVLLRRGATAATHTHHFTREELGDIVGRHCSVVAYEFVGKRGLVVAVREER